MGWLLWLSALAAVAALVAGAQAQQLSPGFYNATCPALLPIVRRCMARAVRREPRMGASVLRLFFHDCFVNGCDASVLLDDVPGNFTGEKNAGPNANSLRGYEVIDDIKAQVEASCKATVSCADILALAARDAVNLLGGPSWAVPLGRRDARNTSANAANTNLPPPDASLSTLLSMFKAKGLDARDLTALSGAHTVGQARCAVFRSHIYNDTATNATFAANLRANVCPFTGGDGNLAPLEPQAPDAFDNGYFRDLVARRVLLRSDQALYGSVGAAGNNGTTDALVRAYAANGTAFAGDFAAAMVRMGNLGPAAGNGEVRLNCRRVN
ncbi:Peroxidase 4 [Dichanthelium oligosanthes]|uniref:Peroxidase n=1 Tax=Dichanthelium oligosanthes TaxID=888268 RepID=A0A1E5V5Y4_9POAL|nr:Peroxidase 4 [Dichanthelium oligosanthes]